MSPGILPSYRGAVGLQSAGVCITPADGCQRLLGVRVGQAVLVSTPAFRDSVRPDGAGVVAAGGDWRPRLPWTPEEELRPLAGCRPHVQSAVRPGLGEVGQVFLPRRYHCLCHLARPAQLLQEALHPLPFVRWHSHH